MPKAATSEQNQKRESRYSAALARSSARASSADDVEGYGLRFRSTPAPKRRFDGTFNSTPLASIKRLNTSPSAQTAR